MKSPVVAIVVVAGLAGCPASNTTNPAVLWLAPDMAETAVKLVDSMPSPF